MPLSDLKPYRELKANAFNYDRLNDLLKCVAVSLDPSQIGVTISETASGMIHFANKRLCDMLGYTAKELSNISFVAITMADDLAANVALHKRYVSGEINSYTIEKRYYRKHGSICWGRMTAINIGPDSTGAATTLAFIEDINDAIDVTDASSRAGRKIRLQEFGEFIGKNWNKDIDVSALARQAGVSPRTFFVNFRKAKGATPMAYIKQIRLDRARAMLDAGLERQTVTGIAFHCGFTNLGHFSRDYREAYGELPSATLKRARAKT